MNAGIKEKINHRRSALASAFPGKKLVRRAIAKVTKITVIVSHATLRSEVVFLIFRLVFVSFPGDLPDPGSNPGIRAGTGYSRDFSP